MKSLSAVALAAVMLWVPVDGVAQRDPLKGVTTVNHLVSIGWDSDITGKTEEQYRQELETAFELGLLRAGVRVTDEPGPSLWCSSNVNGSRNGVTVAAGVRVEYREGVVPWAGPGVASFDDFRMATTWDTSLVLLVGINNLEGTSDGEWCAEQFELAWLRANN